MQISLLWFSYYGSIYLLSDTFSKSEASGHSLSTSLCWGSLAFPGSLPDMKLVQTYIGFLAYVALSNAVAQAVVSCFWP